MDAYIRRGEKVGPDTRDPEPWYPSQSLKLGPGTPVKFKSGIPGHLSKFKSGAPLTFL